MVMDLQTIYKDKKVFVTGHTGFKGSWLITWLHSLGAIIKGYSLAPEGENSLYYAIKGDDFCESVIHDIRNKERLNEEIRSFQPDFVFHLAAQPLVRLSYDIPTETFDINSQGTAYVLDALRFLEKPCVAVMITTDKVYLNLEINYPYKEDDKLGGYDPYSASKASAEIVIDSYRNSFFNPSEYDRHKKSVSSARAGNVIGGGDWAKDRIIPDIIRALSTGEPVSVRNPASVRPWQHVMEPLHGYLVLGAHQWQEPVKYAQAYNLGPHTEDLLTVGDLVKKAIDVWGEGSSNHQVLANQPHEAGLLQLDISKALSSLQWSPKLNAAKAIETTIIWYKDFLNKEDSALEITLKSILKFSKSE